MVTAHCVVNDTSCVLFEVQFGMKQVVFGGMFEETNVETTRHAYEVEKWFPHKFFCTGSGSNDSKY